MIQCVISDQKSTSYQFAGAQVFVAGARICTGIAMVCCAPVVLASLAVGIWLAAADESIAGEITMLCVAVSAALILPLLLAFSVAFQGQASAMRVHAGGLQAALKALPPSQCPA